MRYAFAFVLCCLTVALPSSSADAPKNETSPKVEVTKAPGVDVRLQSTLTVTGPEEVYTVLRTDMGRMLRREGTLKSDPKKREEGMVLDLNRGFRSVMVVEVVGGKPAVSCVVSTHEAERIVGPRNKDAGERKEP